MKVIVEHDETASSYLAQYAEHIEYLGSNYKIIDIEEKYLPWLSELVLRIEPNFMMQLSKEQRINDSRTNDDFLNSRDSILVSIGTKDADKRIDAHYNMTTHTLEQLDQARDSHLCQWINCYSATDKIEAIDYIKCIRYLKDLASGRHKFIVIYANVDVPNEKYRDHPLTHKIINNYLLEIKGVLIPRSIQANGCKPHRQETPLYNDLFYRTIKPDEEIYVLLNLVKFREREAYQALGLDHIPIIGDYGMLYAAKRVFDTLSADIRAEVPYPYYLPILTPALANKRNISQDFSYSLISQDLKYRGKDIYIGIVTIDDVDYTSEALRTQEGGSRIACIWQQRRANEGIYYYKEQIDEELGNGSPGQVISLPDGDSLSTMMLGIAGGMSTAPNYTGVATQSEFIVAKLNVASEDLQRIYGGMPSVNAITMGDAMVGARQLINFAREQGRPLVLCIPFNDNIDAHDGSLLYNEILALLTKNDYVTIIIPAGEEADKRHHYGITGQQPESLTINMRVERENQNIVGVIYQRFTTAFTTTLYPPQGVEGTIVSSIDLSQEGITYVNEATVYSNGYRISFYNGAIRILFRIDNPQVGEWRIVITSGVGLVSQIDLWISQQELNEYITLSPSSVFITVGSTANTDNVMAVGGYDKESMVVLRSSGRGYSWDNRIKPLFITDAYNIIAPWKAGQWVSVTGTLPAASIMLGVVATLYSKFIAEQVFPFPNTVVMNSVILSQVQQSEGVEYPNPSEGYGVFDIEALDALLNVPFVL